MGVRTAWNGPFSFLMMLLTMAETQKSAIVILSPTRNSRCFSLCFSSYFSHMAKNLVRIPSRISIIFVPFSSSVKSQPSKGANALSTSAQVQTISSILPQNDQLASQFSGQQPNFLPQLRRSALNCCIPKAGEPQSWTMGRPPNSPVSLDCFLTAQSSNVTEILSQAVP